MGLFDKSSSSNFTDNSIDDDSIAGDSEGNFSFESEEIGGGESSTNIVNVTQTDRGSVAQSFEFAGESLELAADISSDAFDFAGDTFGKTTNTLADVINDALSFASSSHKTATESAQIQQAQQSAGFTESLRTLNQTVSSALTQGSTDTIKYVMLGLAAVGIAYSLKGK